MQLITPKFRWFIQRQMLKVLDGGSEMCGGVTLLSCFHNLLHNKIVCCIIFIYRERY